MTPEREASRPVIVEFAGLPGAGKTSTVDLLDRYFRRAGWRARVIAEGAQSCPIGQEHRVPFAAWSAHRIANVLLEETFAPRPCDVLLIDRGLFDAEVFTRLLAREGLIADAQSAAMLAYLRLPFLAALTDLVLLYDLSPAESLRRRMADSLTQRRGPILNEDTLGLLAACYAEAARERAATSPPLRSLDAEHLSIRGLAERAAASIEALLAARAPRAAAAGPGRGGAADG